MNLMMSEGKYVGRDEIAKVPTQEGTTNRKPERCSITSTSRCGTSGDICTSRALPARIHRAAVCFITARI